MVTEGTNPSLSLFAGERPIDSSPKWPPNTAWSRMGSRTLGVRWVQGARCTPASGSQLDHPGAPDEHPRVPSQRQPLPPVRRFPVVATPTPFLPLRRTRRGLLRSGRGELPARAPRQGPSSSMRFTTCTGAVSKTSPSLFKTLRSPDKTIVPPAPPSAPAKILSLTSTQSLFRQIFKH